MTCALKSRTALWLVLLSAFSGGTASAAPPALSALTFLPGDQAVGPAWGDQSSPDIARGGEGFLAVWSDSRAHEGKADVYGIRLDAAGAPIDRVAFAIDQGEGSQTSPLAEWNGSNWLVSWLDEGTVTAARVSPAGVVLDAPIVIASPGAAASMALASDGSGWAVVWAGTSAGNADTRGARIAGDGAVLDPGGIVILPEAWFIRGSFALAFAQDEYMLVWPEWTSSRDNDVLGHRLSPDLQKLDAAPFTLASSPNADNAPAIAANGSEFYLVWKQSDRSVWVNGIFGTRVSLAGTASTPEGVSLGDPRSYGDQPDVAWDGTLWIAAWTALGVHAARIAADGTVLDPAGFALAASADFDMREVSLAGGPGGGARATWQDYRNHKENDIWGGFAGADGSAGAEAAVSLGLSSQQNPRVVWNGSGYTIAFLSQTSGGSRILVQRLDAAGAPVDAEPVEAASGDLLEPGIAWSGTRYLVTWRNRTAVQVQARRFSPDLAPEDAAPIDVMIGENPSVAANGDVFLVTAEKPYSVEFRDVFAQRVDGAAGATVGPLIDLIGGFAWGSTVGVIGDRWLVVWEAHGSHNDSPYTLATAWIRADGTTDPGTGLSGGSGWGNAGVKVASHSSLGAIVYSTTRAPSASNGEVYLIRVQADGTLLDGTAGILVTEGAPAEQYAPASAWDGLAFVTTFQDNRRLTGLYYYPRSDVYGARVDGSGTLLDTGGGFPIENTGVAEFQPAVAGSGTGDALTAASHLRGGDAGSLRIGVRVLSNHGPSPVVRTVRVTKGAAGEAIITWAESGGATSYDVVRGDVSGIREMTDRVDLGEVVCAADDTRSLDVTDAAVTPAGSAVFWLVRPNGPDGPGSYGSDRNGLESLPSSGDCP